MDLNLSFFVFLLGIFKAAPTLINAYSGTGSLVPPDEHSHSLENLIDSRFKKLSVGFQVQIDELKLTVGQLQASKSKGDNYADDNLHQLHKRQTKSSTRARAVCESSSSLCTFYHPDHPDVGRTNATYNNGKVTNKAVEVIDNPNNFKGMPTSCKDLQLLGYKLNGFYSVKASQPYNRTKIETVFCDFQSPITDLIDGKGMETKIGAVDIKSLSVHFSVSIKNEYGNKNEKIKFQNEVLNIGGGYDWENQWFRAPYNGTYFFSLSGSKNSPPPFPKIINKLDIGFYINGQGIDEILSSENTLFGSVSYQFSMKLNAGDKVELIMFNGKVFALYFTGWMVEEELNI